MTAGQVHEHIFQTRLPGSQVKQLQFLHSNHIEKRGNRGVWLADGKADDFVFVSNGVNSRKCFRVIEKISIRTTANCKLHDMMASEALDKPGWRALGDDLAVINYSEAIAKTLGFVHVVCRQKHRTTGAQKCTDDLPKLAPALRIESGGRFIKKKNFWIADKGCCYRQPLSLSARQFAHPCVRFLGEL